MSDRNSVITATSYYILAEPLHNKLDQDPSLRHSIMDTDFDETYVLLLLADSNLPTGSFVASSGFESYGTHGFLSLSSASSAGKGLGRAATAGTIAFIQDSLHTYARSALPFVSDAHRAVDAFKAKPEIDYDATIKKLLELDELYETMTLNHVAKRASKAQGVALLTLYAKGFACPPGFSDENHLSKSLTVLIDRLKLMVRGEETHGHLPVCWGVLTGALGISLLRAQHLFLFLHARSLLSSAVRLNTIGPYSSQQLLLHSVRPLVEAEVSQNKDMRTGIFVDMHHNDADDRPATTWPLGEILAVRHDLQHSRIFNS
jgi:urease accessory protein